MLPSKDSYIHETALTNQLRYQPISPVHGDWLRRLGIHLSYI